MADNEVRMMLSAVPGTMTGFAALNAGLVSINNVFGAMTRSIDAQFGLIDAAVITTGVVVTQLGVDAMNAFGQFEQGMKIVQMVSGQTREEIGYLGQKANEFSVQYRVDIDQITEGLQTLGRAGLNSASEQAEVLQNGLNTAKLEGRDLNSVLQELIQNTALLGGNLKSPDFGEQSEYVNDLLVATSMTAPITTHDVSETLKYSGGIAAAAGADINSEAGREILEDYMGAIAAFAQKGVTGSIAGTALRAFFNKPATQDSSVKEALGTLQLKPEYLWEEDEDTMKPVSEQIAIIEGQMEKLNISTMDRLQIWSKIVGGKMGQQMMKLHAEDIKEITSDIRNAEDASDLAAGSMKTYEANLKAAGEAGAVLQRNVGEKLVFFANPILEIINKILSFAQNDFMSWPIAIGILTFVGTLARKIRAIISSIKSEISTLYSGMQQGINFFTRKGGVVRIGDNPINDDKGGSGGSFVSRKSDSSSRSSVKEVEMPATLKAFDKKFAKTVTQSGPFTYQAFKEAGISDERAALAGRLSGLTKAVKIGDTNTGIAEGQFWAAAIKNNLLSESQINKMLGAYRSGANARPLADMVGIESVITKIKMCEQAMNELGLSMTAFNWTEEEKIAAEKFVRQSIDETTNSIIKESNAQKEKEIAAEEAALLEKEITSEEKLAKQQLAQQAQQAASHTTALGENVKIVTQNIATNITISLQEIELEVLRFMEMAKGISAFNAIPVGTKSPIGTNPQSNYVYTPYTVLPKNIHELMNSPHIPHKIIEDRARELRANSLAAKDTEMRAKALEHAYNNPHVVKEGTPADRTARRIDDRLRGDRLKNDFKEYNDAQATHYKNLTDNYINKIRSTYQGAGVGGVSGRLPTQEAIDASIKANQEAAQRNVYTSRGSLSTEPSGLGKNNLVLNKDEINKFNDSIKRLTHRANSITQSHPDANTSGLGKLGLGRNDILKIQENARESINSSMRKVNDAVVNGASRGMREQGIVTRDEINRIRKESTRQWKQSVNARKMNKSLPVSNQVFTTTPETTQLEKRIEERFKKLEAFRKAGGVEGMLKRKEAERYAARDVPEQAYIRGGWGDNRALSYYALSQSQKNQIAEAEYEDLKKMKRNTSLGVPGGFWSNFSDRLNRDRTGSFFSFGKEAVDPKDLSLGFRSATKGIAGFGNKVMNATDLLGGPYMIAMMAITSLMQLWQGLFQDFCEDLKEASNKLQEAYSKWTEAENSLRQTYREGNPEATDEEVDQMVYDTYATMNTDMENALKNKSEDWFKKLDYQTEKKEYEYDEETDDGTTKEKTEDLTAEEEHTKAIKANTGALYETSNEVVKALNNYTRIAQDTWWGVDGWTGWLTDLFGGFLDKLVHIGTHGSTFTENGSEFLLTQSQADENYAGNTEMAGLMLEDFKDAKGNWISGLRTMMGDDVEDMAHLFYKGSSTNKYLKDMAKFSAGQGQGGLSSAQNMKIQKSMQNDPKTWKKLGKELAKRDSNKKANKNIEKNQKRIEGLVGKIRSTVGSGFRNSQILQAAYLYQLQDMKEITDQSIVPIMQTNMVTAAKTLTATGSVDENTGNTVGTTDGTYQNAAIIAGLVAIIAKQSAKGEYFDTALAASRGQDITGDNQVTEADYYWWDVAHQEGMTADKYYAQATKEYDEGLRGQASGGRGGILRNHLDDATRDKKMEGALGYLRLYETTAKMTGFDYDPKAAAEEARRYADEVKKGGVSLNDAVKTAEKNYTQSEGFKQKIVDAYNMSGDDDEGSGGGGGGGGSDSGDKGNQGSNKKERVDLVLCNKKEIPKLNVNLFKKPPSFTVLNKNFKLRDVKINTEDTPKAIMSSIKNAFIDVQKRTDPKIIQDEDAEYDPIEATDGNPLPSGTAKTRTS